MIRSLRLIALASAVGTGVASAASLQLVEAWQNGTPLPSSTGQFTTEAECAEIVAFNLLIAPYYGYAINWEAGTFTDPVSHITIRQSCVQAEPVYDDPRHPFSEPAPFPVQCPPVGAGTDIWFIYGQSNGGNFGRGRYAAGGATYAYAGNGQCYPLRDPIVGGQGTGAAPWTRLADLMVGRIGPGGVPIERVIVINRATGGSLIERWAGGGDLNGYLSWSLRDAIANGFTPTRIFQHQGESNAAPTAWADLPSRSSAYQAAFASVLVTIRGLGLTAPVYVAQATICNARDANNPSPHDVLWRGPDEYIWKEIGRLAIRDAQQSVVTGVNIKAGPNTDLIDWRKRADGCHFNEGGLVEHAQRWYDVLVNSATPMTTRATTRKSGH